MPIPTPAAVVDVILSDPVFYGCRLKLMRAHEHLETIKNEVHAWSNSHPYHLVSQSNADATRHSLVLHIDKPAPLGHLSAVAADCFHNLRTVLDQFLHAVAIYESGENPPPNEGNLQFPICDCAKGKRGKGGFHDNGIQERIKFLSDSVRAAIEGVQPYNRRHDKLPPLLGLLRDFDNTDKHQLPRMVMEKISDVNFGKLIGLHGPQTVQGFTNFSRVYDGAELAVAICEIPTPNAKFNSEMTIQIAIDHPAGPSGAELTILRSFAAGLCAEVEAIVREVAGAITKL